MGRKKKSKRGKRRKGKKKQDQDAERLKKEYEKAQKEHDAELQQEMERAKQEEKDRHEEELAQMEKRLQAFEEKTTEEELLTEEQGKVDEVFDKDKKSLEDEERKIEILHQKRTKVLKDIPRENKEMILLQIKVTTESHWQEAQKGKTVQSSRILTFKSGENGIVNEITNTCVAIEGIKEEDVEKCRMVYEKREDLIVACDDVGNLIKDEKGDVKLCFLVPEEYLEENEEKERKEIGRKAPAAARKPKVKYLAEKAAEKEYKRKYGEDADDADEKGSGDGDEDRDEDTVVDKKHPENRKEEDREDEEDEEDEEVEEAGEEQEEEGEEGDNEDNEESYIYQRVTDFVNGLMEAGKRAIWEEKTRQRENYEEIRKMMEEQQKKKSKKFMAIRERLEKYKEEKMKVLEETRTKLRKKLEEKQKSFEDTLEYKQISLSLPTQLTVVFNGARTTLVVDTLTDVSDVQQFAHQKFNVPMSSFLYLVDKQALPHTILASPADRIVSIFLGTVYPVLTFRVPEQKHKLKEAKAIRDIEERESDEKMEMIKKKVQRKEKLVLEDIPWPSFLDRLNRREEVNFFHVYNVFEGDKLDFIRSMKRKKAVTWHPDKRCFKIEEDIHEENQVSAKEWCDKISHEISEKKEDLNNYINEKENAVQQEQQTTVEKEGDV